MTRLGSKTFETSWSKSFRPFAVMSGPTSWPCAVDLVALGAELGEYGLAGERIARRPADRTADLGDDPLALRVATLADRAPDGLHSSRDVGVLALLELAELGDVEGRGGDLLVGDSRQQRLRPGGTLGQELDGPRLQRGRQARKNLEDDGPDFGVVELARASRGSCPGTRPSPGYAGQKLFNQRTDRLRRLEEPQGLDCRSLRSCSTMNEPAISRVRMSPVLSPQYARRIQ